MDTVVIYKSKYGSTGKYAQWIAEELGADIFPSSEIKPEDLRKYNVIIYGGSLHASGVLACVYKIPVHKVSYLDKKLKSC